MKRVSIFFSLALPFTTTADRKTDEDQYCCCRNTHPAVGGSPEFICQYGGDELASIFNEVFSNEFFDQRFTSGRAGTEGEKVQPYRVWRLLRD